MNGKITFATSLLMCACIVFSFRINAADLHADVDVTHGEFTAFADVQGGATFGIRDSRSVTPLVIMADDPAYERFRREYQAQSPEEIVSAISEVLKIERTIFLPAPQDPQQQKNTSRLFVFQNITEATSAETAATVELMKFRRDQVENLRLAARKKAL